MTIVWLLPIENSEEPNIPDLENSFDTIICDEGHLIDDSSRGLQYELLLTKLKGSVQTPRKVIFISAILPNVDTIHSWLGGLPGTLVQSDYRPVDINFAFIAPQDANSWRLDFNTIYPRYPRPRSYFLRSFLSKDELRYTNPNSGRQKLVSSYNSYSTLACAAALKAQRTGPVALFTTQKGNNGVTGLANKMLELYSLGVEIAGTLPELSKKLPLLVDYITFQFGGAHTLTLLLQYGIGYHHGDLPQDIRREMEAAIQNSLITILICTSTLAEGVNLPIRTLVIHTIKRFDGAVTKPIENRSIKNIVGRVGRAGKETRGRIIFANNSERGVVESVFKDSAMEPAQGALFRLVSTINAVLLENNIQLSNEIFESQSVGFLSTLDKIDVILLDLIPPDMLFEEMEQSIESTIEGTLAYQYCDTGDLKSRIMEIFLLRTQHLQAKVPKESWSVLKQSGTSPRYWQFVRDSGLLDRPEWLELDDPNNETWIIDIVLAIMDMPTLQITDNKDILRKAILGWMNGYSYNEIALYCGVEIEEVLKLLQHTIGYKLQESMAQLTQLAVATYDADDMSELAINWTLLLQYGLTDLQQLDLFERGARASR